MTNLGLILIIISWLIQFVFLYQKKYQIQPLFVLIYCFGVLALVIDGYSQGLNTLATLNLFSLISSAIVLYLIKDHLKL